MAIPEGIFDSVQQSVDRTRQSSGGGGLRRAAESAELDVLRNKMARKFASAQAAQPGWGSAADRRLNGSRAWGADRAATGEWTLGQAPSHHGWAGLTDTTKEWALRTMGQFPELRFTSGYRSPSYNATIPGAAPNSGHTRGEKVDFAVTGWSAADYQRVVDWLQQYGARTLVHDGGTGLHLDVSFAGLGV